MSPDIEAPLENRPLSSRVEALAGFGLSTADIAACSPQTSRTSRRPTPMSSRAAPSRPKHGSPKASTARRPVKVGRPSAAIFWLKTRARWKETSIHELEGKLDTSVTFVTTYEDMELL